MKKYLLITAVLFICLSAFSQRIITADQLAYAKRNLNNIPNGSSAQKALIKNAEKELEKDLIPVTLKDIIAGSGDKHDYVSMGPYWWPDSTKTDGLPYIRRDGLRNPEIEKLDRVKLDKLSKGVNTLAYAYYFTGEEKYARKAIELLRIWFLNEDTKMNPNLNYAQMIHGRNDNKGRGEGIIDTYCFVEMTDCISILSNSMAMTKNDYNGLKAWFSDFLDWLLTSDLGKNERDSKNNHGTAYDIQVTAYALFADRKDVAKEFINNFAESRMYKQIEPDGSQPLELARTIAMHYSIFNIDHMMDMAALAKSTGVNIYKLTSADGRSINKAIQFIVPYLGKPQSEFPYQQIKEWEQNQQKLCWLLRRSSQFEKNKEYDKLFDKYCTTKSSDFRWLIYAN
ncbi:MAG: alginate lyase family protein [Dysgonomonas sp.]|nr:alginate lyase family protein [Dysgonomonas sp.]